MHAFVCVKECKQARDGEEDVCVCVFERAGQ